MYETVTSRQLLCQGVAALTRSVSTAGMQGRPRKFRDGWDGEYMRPVLYNMVSVTDELGFNENQLATLLSLSLSMNNCFKNAIYRYFDSAIIAMPQAMQSCA